MSNNQKLCRMMAGGVPFPTPADWGGGKVGSVYGVYDPRVEGQARDAVRLASRQADAEAGKRSCEARRQPMEDTV